LNELYRKLGYEFKDESLLRRALTHPSYWGGKKGENYQRLEFLGDAVLGYVIGKKLYASHPEMDEGELTRARAYLVREETLSRAARRMDVGSYIRLGPGEEKAGGADRPSILCDVFESILAAVLLDGGLAAAEKLILRLLQEELAGDFRGGLDNKSRLQELLQSTGSAPEYRHISTEGPPHAPLFRYQVWAEGECLGEGKGQSKQQAQQEAARRALALLSEKQ